jgi:archaellum biogenesis ATPase FlaH
MSAVLVPPKEDYAAKLEKGLAGPNILVNGESGVGKTYSLGTLVDWCQRNGYEAFYLDIENSLETLLGYWRDRNLPVPECLHWHQLKSSPVSLTQMLSAAKDTGDLSYEMLTKKMDFNRGSNNHFWTILSTMADFKDDRTGKSFGPVDKFTVKQVFMLDSFTELSNAAAKMVIGSKPTMAPPEYGVAQNHLMNFVRLCTQGIPCTFVMTAHPTRDKDEVTGTVRTSIKTVGTAIQPEIPPLFSDMIYAVREGSKFTWDTAAYGVVTKTRYLGYRAGITQDFGQIMDLWLKRGAR